MPSRETAVQANMAAKKTIKSLVGIVLAAVLLYLVAHDAGDPGKLGAAFARAAEHPGWLAVAFAFFGGSLACGVARWRIILRALSIPIGIGGAIRLYAIGHFFNVIVPGATGGDVVKAAVAAADCPGKRPEAVASIATERFIGMVSIFVLTGAIAACRPSFFAECPALGAARVAAMFAGAAALLGTALLFGIDWSKLPHDRDGAPDGEKHAALDVAVRMYRSVRVCSMHPGVACGAAALSVLNQAACVAVSYCIGRALSLDISAADYFTAIPMINVVAGVPLTPGGVGVRETMTCALMGAAGVAAADATVLSLLYNAVVFAWAIVGGVVYLSMRKRQPVGIRQEDSNV